MPSSVEVTWEDRFYPKAWGHPLLREAIVNMYNDHYGCKIEADNVMIFAGGRCAIFTVLAFLKKHVQVRIGNAEWPAYLDIMTQAGIDWKTVKLNKENNFHPPNADYFDREGLNAKTRLFPVISNPGNFFDIYLDYHMYLLNIGQVNFKLSLQGTQQGRISFI